MFFELLCTTELSKRHTHVFKCEIPVNKWCIIGHKLQFLRTNLYLISRTSSGGYVTECAVVLPWFHQCLVTKSFSAQRFHEQHLCVFQNAVTFFSGSEKDLDWKRRFLTARRLRESGPKPRKKNGKHCSALWLSRRIYHSILTQPTSF